MWKICLNEKEFNEYLTLNLDEIVNKIVSDDTRLQLYLFIAKKRKYSKEKKNWKSVSYIYSYVLIIFIN